MLPDKDTDREELCEDPSILPGVVTVDDPDPAAGQLPASNETTSVLCALLPKCPPLRVEERGSYYQDPQLIHLIIHFHLFLGGGIGVRPIIGGGVGTPAVGEVAFLPRVPNAITRSFAAVERFSSKADDDKEDKLK